MREGKHLITYYATDCGGNKVQCNQMIFMKDSIAPVIECPGDIDLALSAQKCDTVITVPLPLKIEDNCGLGDDFNLLVPADTAAAWLTFTGNPDLHNFIADDKTYSFTNVNANVNAPVRLNIYLRGNIESGNEFYTIYDEDGNEMGLLGFAFHLQQDLIKWQLMGSSRSRQSPIAIFLSLQTMNIVASIHVHLQVL